MKPQASGGRPFLLYGIFGFPLGHTLSPGMQERAFRALGLKAFYLPFEVRRNAFNRLMRRLPNLLLDGFNVTVPYKERVVRWLDRVEPSARAIGAVNTVVRRGSGWRGFNTDWLGFLHSLEKEGRFEPRGKNILILGAGGSARAVAYALARRGARTISIANRTKSRAERMVKEFRKVFPRVEFHCDSLGRLPSDIDLVVNATSVGLGRGEAPLIRPKNFPRRTLFYDLIYNPGETRLIREARRSGRRALNGLGMLLYQGAEAFRLWTGRKAPVSVMRQELQRSLRGTK